MSKFVPFTGDDPEPNARPPTSFEAGSRQQSSSDGDTVSLRKPAEGDSTGDPARAPSEAREQWGSRTEFLLALVGMCVGVGNIWRFPFLCFRNGGSPFLLPYLLALATIGVPCFLLELAIGQLYRRGVWHSLTGISPRLGGVALAQVFMAVVICLYYNVIISWALVYIAVSFISPLPYARNSERFWQEQILEQSGGFTQGAFEMSWPLFGALTAAWVLIYFVMRNGIKGSGKVVMVTVLLPYVLLVILFVRGVTLPGAGRGVAYYMAPRFREMTARSWLDGFEQIVYSLGLGIGSNIAYASYNPRDEDLVTDALAVPALNSATSLFGGFVTFSLLGHMARASGSEVADVVSSGEGLAFVVFPDGLASLPAPNLFAVLFFVMLMCLGVDSQLAMVESPLCMLKDLGVTRHVSQRTLVGALCVLMWASGLVFVTHAGIYWFELVDRYVAWGVFIVSACQSVAVTWARPPRAAGAPDFAGEIEAAIGRPVPRYITFMWRFGVPVICVLLATIGLVLELYDAPRYETRDSSVSIKAPRYAHALGMVVMLTPLVLTVGFAAFPVKARARSAADASASGSSAPADQPNPTAELEMKEVVPEVVTDGGTADEEPCDC